MGSLSADLPEPVNFWAYVSDWRNPIVCWQWCGAQSHNGYGYCSVKYYGTSRPHRFTYELIVGKIPDGLQLDHLCKNKLCVNPVHLEPVTLQENVLRSDNYIGKNARKTHCPQGHKYDGVNNLGRRICKECQRVSLRASRARRKIAKN